MTIQPAFPKLTQAYRALNAALCEIQPEADRRIARDALRDALDRARDPDWRHASILADTFAIEETIHDGSAFTVHRLRHRDLGTRHVLKTLRDDRRTEPVLREILLGEAAQMLALSHPAILTARAVLRLADGRPGLLLDHIDGPSLAERLERLPLTVAEVAVLARRLLDAMAAVHAGGILHLDLTPANVLLPDGRLDRAVVGDFGLSLKIGECHARRELQLAASATYASPEQMMATVPLDVRADLFALGRLVEHCLPLAGSDSMRSWAARLCSDNIGDRPANVGEAQMLLTEIPFPESLRP